MSDESKVTGSGVSFTTNVGSPAGSRSARGSPAVPPAPFPFRLVLLSELSARAPHSKSASPLPQASPVDKHSFERLMGQLGPTFAVDIGDPLTPAAGPLSIELRWNSPKAMRVDGLVEQVSVLRSLVEAKKLVERAKDGRISAGDARAQLARVLPRPGWLEALGPELSPPPPPPPRAPPPSTPKPAPSPTGSSTSPTSSAAPAGGLEAMLDELLPNDGAGSDRPPPSEVMSGLSSVVASVVRSARREETHAPVPVGKAIQLLESAFVRILTELLRHPEVRRIESAWRGLKLVVDACDPRAGVELDVVPVERSGVLDALHALAEPTGVDAARAWPGLLVVDQELGAGEEDMALVRAWANVASDMRSPLVVDGGPSVLGLDFIGELARVKRSPPAPDDARLAHLRSAVEDGATAWVTMALNGPLVRPAYTAAASRLRDISFAEDAKDQKSHVFAGPAVAVAVLCAKSHARVVWPTAILGPHDGAVADLPVREVNHGGGQPFAIPLETFVAEDVIAEAAHAGMAVFGCARNHDAAILSRAPVLHRRSDGTAAGSLVEQLFHGRLFRAVKKLAASLPPRLDGSAAALAARELEVALRQLFPAAAPPGPDVTAKVEGPMLHVTVRPRRHAGVMIEELAVEVPLPR
jgi:type VI secretion system protein ImpC